MVERYIAEGNLGCTYGLKTKTGYYNQTRFPDGSFGQIYEVEENSRFGWNYWHGKFNPTEIDSFPEDCDLSEKCPDS
jgi:hypothetical protein